MKALKANDWAVFTIVSLTITLWCIFTNSFDYNNNRFLFGLLIVLLMLSAYVSGRKDAQ